MERKRRRRARKTPVSKLSRVLGERVRALREERAITRTRLAQEARVSLTALVVLEGGQEGESRLSTLDAVARALGVRVADLLDDEPVPPRPHAGSKVFFRLVDRLRRREEDQDFLRTVEKVVLALERAFDDAHG